MNLIKNASIIEAIAPAAGGSELAGDYVSLKNAEHVTVLVHINQGNAATVALTLNQANLDTVSDFKIKQGDKLAFDFDFTAEDVTIALGKTDRKASYDELLSAANDSGAKIFVGYTAADKKNGYAFVDTDDNGSMDMAIKLTGITSSNKIDTASFINVSQVDGLFA